jgi:hypothetical protein
MDSVMEHFFFLNIKKEAGVINVVFTIKNYLFIQVFNKINQEL